MRCFIAICAFGDLLSSFATGVGHDPDPVAAMERVDGTSRYNDRPAGVAVRSQLSQHHVEAHRDVPSNVFSQDETGSDLVNDAAHVRPEMAVILRAQSLPGDREWLAGVAPGNEVDGTSPVSL
ncbi:MAG TPA: hypothetical protein VNJ04_19535 [Gemmatimonadaceae bacterium]|nr:hypothetical protein [Gemmatimonadaceae bacterium]